MQIQAVRFADAWACLSQAVTERVLDIERSVDTTARDLMFGALRKFADQHAPRTPEEMHLRYMQMTALFGVIGAIANADFLQRTNRGTGTELMVEARHLSDRPLPVTAGEFNEMNRAFVSFCVGMPSKCADEVAA